MEWLSDNWWWIVFLLMSLVGAGKLVFDKWRDSRDRNDAEDTILSLVEQVLNSLYNIFRDEAREIDLARVEKAARDVYKRYILPTHLARFVSEEYFVSRVLEAWKDVVGIEEVVAHAVSGDLNGRARIGFSPPV